MANTLISGPAGAGKSQRARAEKESRDDLTIIADFQSIYVALSGDQRDANGRYPLRDERLLPITEYVRRAAITGARERGIGIVATNSDGSPERRRFLLQQLGDDSEEIIEDPGEDVVKRRLRSKRTGKLSRSCGAAIGRWYGRVSRFGRLGRGGRRR